MRRIQAVSPNQGLAIPKGATLPYRLFPDSECSLPPLGLGRARSMTRSP